MTQNCPNFRMNIWFHIVCQIFAKLFKKKHEGGEGSDKYEIWHVWQLDHVEKKVHNSFFVRPANIFQMFFTIFFIERVFGGHYLPRSTGPQYIHYILSIFRLNCYWFFYRFAGLWACNQLAPKYRKWKTHQIFLSEKMDLKKMRHEEWIFLLAFS